MGSRYKLLNPVMSKLKGTYLLNLVVVQRRKTAQNTDFSCHHSTLKRKKREEAKGSNFRLL
ncbi:uncharacterized protein DS421_20g694570 [Arachis hypogaea]|nr:uncharacterized protein DS421_20g694570 [Arachis hypogaea]